MVVVMVVIVNVVEVVDVVVVVDVDVVEGSGGCKHPGQIASTFGQSSLP